jgi:hypothetical protein
LKQEKARHIKIFLVWTIPGLFPGSVDRGLIAKKIFWYALLKAAIFVADLAGVAGIRRGERKSSAYNDI